MFSVIFFKQTTAYEMRMSDWSSDVCSSDLLEQTRAELVRFSRAQRDTLDRLSAGVAQFAADRTLVFFNQPFARSFALEPDWLAEGPEFDRVPLGRASRRERVWTHV